MVNTIKWAIKNRRVTILLAIMVAILGVYSYITIPKQENPDTTPPVALITTIYPGASSQQVETLVTNIIEEEAMSLDGLDYVNSFSQRNVSVVVINLKFDTDAQEQWDKLSKQIALIEDELPLACSSPEIQTDFLTTPGIILSLSGDDYSFEELETFANEIQSDLRKIDGITKVDIEGQKEKVVIVNVDQEKLALSTLSMEEINGLIASQNTEIPIGTIDTDEGIINVNIPGSYTSVVDIEDIVIGASSEGVIQYLKDIASVSIELENDKPYFTHNDKYAILLSGYFESGKNIVTIGADIQEVLDDFSDRYSNQLSIDKILCQPESVSESVNEFIISLLLGILFVLIVVFIGMGFRNAITVSAAVPLSILITLGVMKIMNIQLQQISIAALIISLGILVDNAIVISNCIQDRINKGEKNIDAAINGTKEAAIPVLTSTLTTIAAFAPFIFLPGVAGEFVNSLPKVVIIALISSYVLAVTFIPALSVLLYRPRKQKISSQKAILKVVKASMVKKRLVIVVAFFVFIGSIGAILLLELELFPYADKDVLYIDLRSDVKGNIDSTKELADEVNAVLKELDGVNELTTAYGRALPKFYLTMPVYPDSSDFAQIRVAYELKDTEYKSRELYAQYLQNEIESKITEGYVQVNLLALTKPGPKIDLRIAGDSLTQITSVAEEMKKRLSEYEGSVNVLDNIPTEVDEYIITVDKYQASLIGLSIYDIQKTANTVLYGYSPTMFRQGMKEYDILVKSDIYSIEELENIYIKSPITGQKTMLSQIASVSTESQLDEISHYNGDLSITVSSNVKPEYSFSKLQKIANEYIEESEQRGIVIGSFGEEDLLQDVFSDVIFLGIVALCAIFIILLIQFRKFVYPIIILCTVPLSVTGSIFGLLIFNQPLSLTALLGVVSLFGIVVNNAILLVEYINREKKEGKDIYTACIHAVEKRISPIILTTTTTVIGLIPLVLSGSSFFVPMAVALMSGLLISTLLTIVVIPVVYYLIIGKRKTLEAIKISTK